MLSAQLTAESFAGYPPQGRAFAVEHLAILQKLPLAFAALLLQQAIVYDWLFPAERRALGDQLSWLESLSPADFARLPGAFALPNLDEELGDRDWVQHPRELSEALTAWLWSSHQIDRFSAVADTCNAAWRRAFPEPQPVAPRLAVVVFGPDLQSQSYPLFRKLLPHGVHVAALQPEDAWPAIWQAVSTRAAQHALPFEHWYVDGGAARTDADPRLATVTWAELAPARTAILHRMQSVIRSGHGGPEELRTLMAATTPKDIGLANAAADPTLSRFKVSVLAEGSGTQIFSTTFVQWTAREVLRRAQPSTLLLRFQPRQRQLPMNELIAGTGDRNAVDAAGSLIDADMAATYTWIDQQRLPGADQASLIVWSEAHRQALVIGPNAPRGATAANSMTMRQILTQFL